MKTFPPLADNKKSEVCVSIVNVVFRWWYLPLSFIQEGEITADNDENHVYYIHDISRYYLNSCMPCSFLARWPLSMFILTLQSQ